MLRESLPRLRAAVPETRKRKRKRRVLRIDRRDPARARDDRSRMVPVRRHAGDGARRDARVAHERRGVRRRRADGRAARATSGRHALCTDGRRLAQSRRARRRRAGARRGGARREKRRSRRRARARRRWDQASVLDQRRGTVAIRGGDARHRVETDRDGIRDVRGNSKRRRSPRLGEVWRVFQNGAGARHEVRGDAGFVRGVRAEADARGGARAVCSVSRRVVACARHRSFTERFFVQRRRERPRAVRRRRRTLRRCLRRGFRRDVRGRRRRESRIAGLSSGSGARSKPRRGRSRGPVLRERGRARRGRASGAQ